MTLQRKILKGTWLCTKKSDPHKSRKYGRKIHISLGDWYTSQATVIQDSLNALLDKGVSEGLISSYKVYRYEELLNQGRTFSESRLRYIKSIPYTIHLFDKFNPDKENIFDKLIQFLKDIEVLLKDVPLGDEKYLSQSDLSLTARLKYRQSRKIHIDKTPYLSAFSKEAAEISKDAERSSFFCEMKSALNTVHEMKSEDSGTVTKHAAFFKDAISKDLTKQEAISVDQLNLEQLQIV